MNADDLSLARAASTREVASRPALITGDVTRSFGDLAERAASMRAALARRGVGRASRVAVMAPNGVGAVIAIHALIDLGATLVPVHPRLGEAEAEAQIADAAPLITLREDDLARLGASRDEAPPPAIARAEDALAMVYTSGTSGRAKGAVLSRRALLAAAAGSAANLGWIERDAWLGAMPLCHVGGLSIITRCLIARRPVILEPRFDAEAVLTSIARRRPTLLSVVPTMLRALLERDAANVLASLRAVLVGGAAAPFALLEECARRGVPALTTYGLTEACSQVTVQRPRAPSRVERGSGAPLAGVDLRVTRADGSPADAGEAGRILVRGATLMDGYFRGPGAPLDRAVDQAGFFDTGDLGEIDPDTGVLVVHARRTDLVITGGENVYPVEVEQRLEAIAGVRRALVFGVPDDHWGQIVAALFELEEGVSLDEVRRAADLALAPHKRPRLAAAVAALPLTAAGKLDRARAVARHADALTPRR